MAGFKQNNGPIYGNQYNAIQDNHIHQRDRFRSERMETATPAMDAFSQRSPGHIHSVFLSYAPEDLRILNDLKTHLAPLQRAGLITTWYDHNIRAGANRQKEINAYFLRADLILLLISPHFMASDYSYGVEMQQALKRHEQGEAHVIPLILRSVYWHDAPFSTLQALPRNGEPIMSSTYSSLDEAFLEVVGDIRHLIGELDASGPS
jgi:TIR domain